MHDIAKRRVPEHYRAFKRLKQGLTEVQFLRCRNLTEVFMIHVDAGYTGAGAFSAQQNGDGLAVIAYFSQRFNDSQRHHSATLKES